MFCPCINAGTQQYLTHYCIVRADLPFGAQAAQLIHAAGYSATAPLPEGTYAIALHARDEPELRALAARLAAAGVAHKLIVEDDPPYAGQATAIGITPCNRSPLKPYLAHLALVAQPDRAPGVMTRAAPGLNPGERTNIVSVAQPGRAPRVMTSEVGGSNPSGHATSRSPVQRMRRWFGG